MEAIIVIILIAGAMFNGYFLVGRFNEADNLNIKFAIIILLGIGIACVILTLFALLGH